MCDIIVQETKQPCNPLYSQNLSWNSYAAQCGIKKDRTVPGSIKIGEFLKTRKSHPWRPSFGYEEIEAVPLPSIPITNHLVDSCCLPKGMITEPLKFPNLVTGFERNPSHAARAALYTRYTNDEWTQNALRLYNEADSNKHYSESLRDNTINLLRDGDEITKDGQVEAGRKIGERITDVFFWKNEVSCELEKMLKEIEDMQSCKRDLQLVLHNLEGPLNIAQECLYHRESRRGIDLVHDDAEKALLNEVELIKNSQKKLECLKEKADHQLANNRASQNQLELDAQAKEMTLGIDKMCHQLNSFSRGLKHYAGIENYNPSINDPETWVAAVSNLLKRSREERTKSCKLRSDVETAVNNINYDVWNAWMHTNNSLSEKITETLEAKGKLQIHLYKIQREMFDVEKNLEMVEKAVADKNKYLQVAQTRLEARSHRPTTESCRDYAHMRIAEEIDSIKKIIECLNKKWQQLEVQHQQLLRTRANLETDLKSKVDTIFIDREKCLGLRRSYPITSYMALKF